MKWDIILVGGGLQNALIALAILEKRPALRVALVEKGATLGGNHTWSFHADDVPDGALGFVDPIVSKRWPGYTVRFPNFERRLAHTYASVTSDRLHAVISERFARRRDCSLLLGQLAERVGRRRVTLASGEELEAEAVIDARGPGAWNHQGAVGYQKFVGLELDLEQPAALAEPVVMDATVAQSDGFRFVYALPFTPTRWLIEDTCFANGPDLDVPRFRDNALAYAVEKLGRVRGVVREERGVLPLPWRSGRASSASGGPLVAGYAGGWFHPVTGYSFPVAVRLARRIACVEPGELFEGALDDLFASHRRQSGFFHLLNRLLFLGIEPDLRWRTLARFYSLPEDTIRRFYALELTHRDRARILLGRPPPGLSLRGMMAVMEA